jgi:SAM-dependent methyltransferase
MLLQNEEGAKRPTRIGDSTSHEESQMTEPGVGTGKRGFRWDPSGDARDVSAGGAAMLARGENLHGEADFVTSILRMGRDETPKASRYAVLDGGCGTGRVAIELARRGFNVVGVDINREMLEVARSKAPELEWVQADLATVQLSRTFEAVVLAGNIMIFVEPGSEAAVVANLADHLAPGGLLISGCRLLPDKLTLVEYDAMAAAAGLELSQRWATWDCKPYEDGNYAVSVHRHP